MDHQTGKKTHFMIRLRVVTEALCSAGRLLMEGVLQGPVLQPLLFNVPISDLEEVTECLPTRFTGDANSEEQLGH